MKKMITMALALVCAVAVMAKDIKTLVVRPAKTIECEKCEKKIKDGLRFVKGVQDVKTDIKAQTITVKYDADKVGEKALNAALTKVGYAKGLAAKACTGECKKVAAECCKAKMKCAKEGAKCEKKCEKKCMGDKAKCEKKCMDAKAKCDKKCNQAKVQAADKIKKIVAK